MQLIYSKDTQLNFKNNLLSFAPQSCCFLCELTKFFYENRLFYD